MADNITLGLQDDNVTTEAPPQGPVTLSAHQKWRLDFIRRINKAKTPVEAVATINAILMFLIIVGNIWVIIAVIRQPKLRKKATNIFIVSLSISDLIIGVVFIPLQTADFVNGRVISDPSLCFFTVFLHSTAQCATSLSLICIAIDRYRAIVTPLKPKLTPQHGLIGVAVVWALCCLFSVQVHLNTGIRYDWGLRRDICTITNVEIDRWMRVEYAIMLYLIPLIILTALYAIMIKSLWFGKSPSNSSSQKKKKAVKMLSFVVFQFALTWAPYWCFQIYFTHEKNPPLVPILFTDTIPNLTSQIFYCNSFINPILYAYYNENFRQEFNRLFPCLVKKAKVAPESANTGQTGTGTTTAKTNTTHLSNINSTTA